MLEERQHLLLNYFKPRVLVGPGMEPEPPVRQTGALPTRLTKRPDTFEKEKETDSEQRLHSGKIMFILLFFLPHLLQYNAVFILSFHYIMLYLTYYNLHLIMVVCSG